jgi:predicted ATP-grasp superfamily ATP-dependent carboligase
MKIIVTNARNRIAYNIVRSLGARGLKVYAGDFVPRAMAFHSRYATGKFIYPSPFREQENFIHALIERIQTLDVGVLIPVFEELFLVSRYKELVSRHVRMVVPDYSQILTAHNKDRWEPIAGSLGIAVPRTFDLERYSAEPDAIRDLPFPLLIKPKQGGGGWGIRQVNSAAGLKEILAAGAHEGLPWERFLLQEMIRGETLCVAMIFCRGHLRGKVTYRQIREYPAFGGQATCRISIVNRAAEENLRKFLEHLGWHGVCQADFVVERTTGKPYLIDINPRFWGSLAQGIASGVDFPYLIYQIAVDGDVEPVEGFREGVVTRWLGGEASGFFQHYALAPRKLEFLRQFFNPGTSATLFDDFSLRDPLPFLVWGMDAIYRMAKFRDLKPHESLAGIWE